MSPLVLTVQEDPQVPEQARLGDEIEIMVQAPATFRRVEQAVIRLHVPEIERGQMTIWLRLARCRGRWIRIETLAREGREQESEAESPSLEQPFERLEDRANVREAHIGRLSLISGCLVKVGIRANAKPG